MGINTFIYGLAYVWHVSKQLKPMKTYEAKVEIQADGKTARTLNILGQKPIVYDDANSQYGGSQMDELAKWQQAEQQRLTLDIENQVMFPEEIIDDVGLCLYQPGTIHTAEINEETSKCIILCS